MTESTRITNGSRLLPETVNKLSHPCTLWTTLLKGILLLSSMKRAEQRLEIMNYFERWWWTTISCLLLPASLNISAHHNLTWQWTVEQIACPTTQELRSWSNRRRRVLSTYRISLSHFLIVLEDFQRADHSRTMSKSNDRTRHFMQVGVNSSCTSANE